MGRGEDWTDSLGNALGNDGNALDLWELHELHGGLEDGARRGKVDDGVDIGVLGDGLVDGLVDGQQGFAGAPVPLRGVRRAHVGGEGRGWLGTHILLTNWPPNV